MDLIFDYGSDEEKAPINTCSAPFVSTAIVCAGGGTSMIVHGENSQASVMLAPQLGPKNPFHDTVSTTSHTRSGLGIIEATFVEDHSFNSSYQKFLREDKESTTPGKEND